MDTRQSQVAGGGEVEVASVLAALLAHREDALASRDELVRQLLDLSSDRQALPSDLWAVLRALPARPLDAPTPESVADSIWPQFLRLRRALASLSSVEAAGIRTQLSTALLASDVAVWSSFLPLCLWLQTQQATLNRRMLIGICGPPGAGKTVLSEILTFALNHANAFDHVIEPHGEGESADVSCVFAFDAYHYPNAYLDSNYVERDGIRVPLRQFKGDPISFDVSAFVRDLQRIKQCREQISLPVYDRRLHDPVPDALTIKPHHTFVIVEGMLLLHDQLGFEAIKDHLDVCLFLDVDEPECHRRVVARKIAGGRDADDAEQHYVRVDRPNVVRVNERRERADLLLRLGPDGVVLSARPGLLSH